MAAYVSAKEALWGYTKALSSEIAHNGIFYQKIRICSIDYVQIGIGNNTLINALMCEYFIKY